MRGLGPFVGLNGGKVDMRPRCTTLPVVTGSGDAGVVMSCTTGTWKVPSNGPVLSYSYQWFASGAAIGGATASTYTVSAGNAGAPLYCAVTATNKYGMKTVASNGIELMSVVLRGVKHLVRGIFITLLGATPDVPGTLPADATVLLGSNGSAPAKVTTTATGRGLISSASILLGLMNAEAKYSAVEGLNLAEDFLNGPTGIGLNLASVATTGTNVAVAVDGRVGVNRSSCGNAATLNIRASLSGAANPGIFFGVGEVRAGFRCACATGSFSASPTGNLYIGFTNQNTTSVGTRVAMFRSVNGANWFTTTIDAGGTTEVDTGIAPTVGVWHDFLIVVNADATEVKFYIDGVLVQTHVANIPKGAGQSTALMVRVHKSVAVSGDVAIDTDLIALLLPYSSRIPGVDH